MSSQNNNPRIISGKYKNSKLVVPYDARPVTDRVKRTIFDILDDYVTDTLVIDLFCGSGSFGIEALSRDAQKTIFMDVSEDSIEALQKNLDKIGIERNMYRTVRTDFDNFIKKNRNIDADLVFVDPPFYMCDGFPVFKILRILKDHGVAVLKVPSDTEDLEIPKSFEIKVDKTLGINRVLILQKIPRN